MVDTLDNISFSISATNRAPRVGEVEGKSYYFVSDERFGEMDFTPFGVSGAIIMDMASSIGDALKNGGAATLHIDLKPALEPERLDARIARDFEEFSGDALRFAVRKLLPREIIPAVLIRAGLDMGKPCGETTPEERLALTPDPQPLLRRRSA